MYAPHMTGAVSWYSTLDCLSVIVCNIMHDFEKVSVYLRSLRFGVCVFIAWLQDTVSVCLALVCVRTDAGGEPRGCPQGFTHLGDTCTWHATMYAHQPPPNPHTHTHTHANIHLQQPGQRTHSSSMHQFAWNLSDQCGIMTIPLARQTNPCYLVIYTHISILTPAAFLLPRSTSALEENKCV